MIAQSPLSSSEPAKSTRHGTGERIDAADPCNRMGAPRNAVARCPHTAGLVQDQGDKGSENQGVAAIQELEISGIHASLMGVRTST